MSETASKNPSLGKRHPDLRVGGLIPLSTCDWPGQLAATVFCQGCAWDCAYCHNPHLRPMQADAQESWQEVFAFLKTRRGLLDAVVFSGGEPTLQPALLHAVEAVRGLGFRVGLHTAGMAPERFAPLLPLVDWVGFDVKAPFDTYASITGVERSGDKARASLNMLLASGVPYEVRTTVHPALLTPADMLALRDQLLTLGVTHYAIQHFRATGANRMPPLADPSGYTVPPRYAEGFLSFTVR